MLFVDKVSIGEANFHRMTSIVDRVDRDWNVLVDEDNVAIAIELHLERKLQLRLFEQADALPNDNEHGVVVAVQHLRVRGIARVEVGHQRGDVLGGRQPRVQMITLRGRGN